MKHLSINLLSNILLLLVGIILLIFHAKPDLLSHVARAMGVLFLIPSFIYLVMVAMPRKDAAAPSYMGVLPAIGGLCFAVVLLARAELFTGALSVMLGVLLIVLGLFHVVYLFLSRKSIRMSLLMILLPLVIVGCGVAVLFLDSVRASSSTVVMLTGCSLIAFCLTSLLEHWGQRKAARDNRDDHDGGPCVECETPQNGDEMHVEL